MTADIQNLEALAVTAGLDLRGHIRPASKSIDGGDTIMHRAALPQHNVRSADDTNGLSQVTLNPIPGSGAHVTL